MQNERIKTRAKLWPRPIPTWKVLPTISCEPHIYSDIMTCTSPWHTSWLTKNMNHSSQELMFAEHCLLKFKHVSMSMIQRIMSTWYVDPEKDKTKWGWWKTIFHKEFEDSNYKLRGFLLALVICIILSVWLFIISHNFYFLFKHDCDIRWC